MTKAAALIWCPFPDPDSARSAISALLDERLVACGNCVPGVSSMFVWDGRRDESDEVGVLFKTTASRLDDAMGRLEALHPYEQPAISGWTARASQGTLDWLENEIEGEGM